jgi:hypothetical protein
MTGRRAKPRGGVAQANRSLRTRVHSRFLDRALRDLPRAQCRTPTKVRYRSRKAAESAAEKQWREAGRILYAYPCIDHFHLTSQRTHP